MLRMRYLVLACFVVAAAAVMMSPQAAEAGDIGFMGDDDDNDDDNGLMGDENRQPAARQRISWSVYSGAGGAGKVKLILFASNAKTVDVAALNRPQVVQAVRAAGVLTEIVNPPKNRGEVKTYRELVAKLGVRGVPVLALVAPDGGTVAFLPLDSRAILQAMKNLQALLKQYEERKRAPGR